MPDLVGDLVACVLRELGIDPTPDDRIRAETAVRLRYGGERVHVRKMEPKQERYRRIAIDLDRGLTYREAAIRHGVSLRTALRAGKFPATEK